MIDNKKKVLWVTPDCFLDTDLDYGLISGILKNFDLHWIVLFNKKDNRFSEKDFDRIKQENKNLSIDFLYNTTRARYPKTMFFYLKVKKIIKRVNPDVIYFNVMPSNPYVLPLYFWLPKDKTIVAAHDGRVTASMSFASLIKIGFYKAFQSVKYVNMFSFYQANIFHSNFPKADVTIIPLALKDFGKPTVKKRTDCIGFVYFGTIHSEKNLELLIEAVNQLHEEGVIGFKVSINGKWRVAWKPEDKIRYPELFELNIGNVPNQNIPNLFVRNHYAVYPYKNMSQSGALKCAYNYHTPVIVSNLPGFTDEMKEGVDGYSFISEDIEDLKRVMRKCLSFTPEEYMELQNRMAKHVETVYSKDIIVQSYVAMFNKVINSK